MTSQLDVIKSIYDWNLKAGLLDEPYSDMNEAAFPIEEALEKFELETLSAILTRSGFDRDVEDNQPKEISRWITEIAHNGVDSSYRYPISDTDRFDKHLDIIVYSFGSLFKLGLSPLQALEGLSAVMDANQQKLQSKIDSNGKLGKPNNFIGPEPELEEILDKRKKE